MTQAKKPQDHLPKVEKPTVEKVQITLGEGDAAREVPAQRTVIRGITVTVADEALDDFELLDDLRAVDVDQNPAHFPALLRRLVGDDYRDVINGLRDKITGRVSIVTGAEFVKEIFEAINPN